MPFRRFSFVFSLAAFACTLLACSGGGDGETSFRLIVNNGPGIALPLEVQIDVYEGTSQQARESITRGVPPNATTRLGDVVIYPAAGTLSLRFAVFGRKDGRVVSSTVVSAAPTVGKQVEVVATLMAGMGTETPIDGGVGEDAGFDAIDSGDDGGVPDGAPPKKAAGEMCGAGAECTSGACVGNVCCDKTCDGSCNSCKAAGQPVGKCVPLADNTKCRDATCSGNRRTLTQFMCKAGACQGENANCANRMCDAPTLMCQ